MRDHLDSSFFRISQCGTLHLSGFAIEAVAMTKTLIENLNKTRKKHTQMKRESILGNQRIFQCCHIFYLFVSFLIDFVTFQRVFPQKTLSAWRHVQLCSVSWGRRIGYLSLLLTTQCPNIHSIAKHKRKDAKLKIQHGIFWVWFRLLLST